MSRKLPSILVLFKRLTRESLIFQYKSPTTSIIIREENKSTHNNNKKLNFIVGVHKFILRK